MRGVGDLLVAGCGADTPEAGLIIRTMEEQDIKDVLQIENASFVSPWTEMMFEEIMSSPIGESLLLTRGSTLLGYIVFYSIPEEAHIMNIAVDPAERRRGYASTLLAYVITLFKQRRICDVYLEVREGNDPAKKLYRNLGFSVIGRRKGYYTETNEDALVLWLLIC